MSSSSSPDPLSLPSAPTISGPSRRLSSRRTPEPQPQPQPLSTSAVQIHSPTKMTAVSNSHLSPWRIKVMVEAERDGDDGERQQQQQEEEEEGCGRLAPPNFTLGFAGGDVLDVKVLPSARQRRSRERSVGVVTRTRTTKVPLKGLDSSPVGAVAAAKTKGRRATPTAPRRPSTPAPKSKARSTSKKAPVTPQPAATPRRSSRRKATAVEVEEDSSDEVQEASQLSGDASAAKLPAPKSPDKPRTSRTPRTLTVSTLASTRSRRSSIAPVSYVGGPASTSRRSTRSASVVSNGERRALSGMDPNSIASLSPSKSNTPVPSAQGSRVSRRGGGGGGESVAPSASTRAVGDIVVATGGSFIVSEGGSTALPEDRSGFPHSIGDNKDLSTQFGSLEGRDEEEGMSEEEALADLTTASVWRSGNTPNPDLEMSYISTATLHTSKLRKDNTGHNDGAYQEGEGEGEDADMDEVSSLLSEELLQPVDMDFTRRSFTPRAAHRSFNAAMGPLFESDPVFQEPFYGGSDASTARDKGKGKAVDEEGETATQEESFYPSSPPPIRVIIPSPQKAPSVFTPAVGNKRRHEGNVPDAPASKRRTSRETPNITLVREASEVMSDALEVEESMQMIEEEFGDGFAGPPTPESQENVTDEVADDDSQPYPACPQTFVQPEQEEEEVSYPTVDNTGIPSPSSSLPQESPPAPPTGYLARIFSPFKRTPSKPAVPAPAQTPSGPPLTPRSRSVHFEDETSIDARQRAADRTALAESEGTAKHAEEVVGSTTSQSAGDATRALLAEWDRQRSDVRRRAEEVGAITIDDSIESNEHSTNCETSPSPVLKFKKPAKTAASSSRTSTPTTTQEAATSKPTVIAPSPPATTPAQEEALIDSLLDEKTAIGSAAAPSSSSSSSSSNGGGGPVWSKADYKHLDQILSSSFTTAAQATTSYRVQLERPERILAKEVVASLALDEDGYLTLSRKESAAVDRFRRREKAKGRDWSLVEVVRRTAGMKVAGRRREMVGNK